MHALAAASNANGAVGAVIVISYILISFGAYFAPAIVALARKVPNAGSVFVIDLFLGWTIIGWIVALAMACRSKAPRYYPPPPQQGPPMPFPPPQPAPENGQ